MRAKKLGKTISIAAAVAAATLAMAACSPAAAGTTAASGSATSAATATFDPALFAMLPQSIQQSKTINVANPFNTSWVSLETDGTTLTGPVPDLSRALEPILGVKFNWINAPFADLITGIQGGKYDVGWGSVSDTKDRQSVVTFVDYASNPSQMFVLKGNPQNIGDLSTLCGKRAATLTGSAQLQELQAQAQKCLDSGQAALQVDAFAGTPDVLLALRSGKTDAFFSTAASAIHTLQANGQDTLFQTAGPAYDSDELSGLAVSTGSGQLAQAMQGALKQLVASGQYQQILEKYGFQEMALTPDQITINGATS